jgi:hypothetical protein
MALIDRVKNILLSPKTEWPKIAGETATVQSLYVDYILILAAIGPIAMALRFSVFGITFAILTYIVNLVITYLLALIVDALAPTFGGRKELHSIAQAHRVFIYRGLGCRDLSSRARHRLDNRPAGGDLFVLHVLSRRDGDEKNAPQEKTIPYYARRGALRDRAWGASGRRADVDDYRRQPDDGR